jgi:hypothetical protein
MMKLLLSTAFFELPCCSATLPLFIFGNLRTSANSVGTLCFAVSRCFLKLPRDGALRVGYPTAMIHLHPPSCLSSICFRLSTLFSSGSHFALFLTVAVQVFVMIIPRLPFFYPSLAPSLFRLCHITALRKTAALCGLPTHFHFRHLFVSSAFRQIRSSFAVDSCLGLSRTRKVLTRFLRAPVLRVYWL